MKIHSTVVFLTFLIAVSAVTLTAASDSDNTSKGVTVRQSVPFSKTTLSEMEKDNKKLSPTETQHEVIPRRTLPPPVKIDDHSTETPQDDELKNIFQENGSSITPVNKLPTLGSNFTAMSGSNYHPPDTMGAAGPGYLVSVVNGGFAIYTKSTGALYKQITLSSFWSSLGSAATYTFDPKILYDQFDKRFIITSASGTSSPNSYVLIGVSATSDPTGTWYLWSIDVDKDSGSTQTNNWGDYPQVGIDQNYVYITVNMYNTTNNFQNIKVLAIAKTQLSASNSTITWTELVKPTGTSSVTTPCHVFGTSQSHYFLGEGYYSSTSTYFKVYSLSMSGSTGTWSDKGYLKVQNKYTPSSSLPSASQSGSSIGLDTGDTRILSSVCRNGYIWASHTVADSTNTRTEAAWYQIDPSKAAASSISAGSTVSEGRVKDSSLSYFYPSIAVNTNNDVALGFSGSSSSIYGSAYYTARSSTDTAGTMQTVSLLKAGLAAYSYTTSTSRWGDYSATFLDPTDESFWTIQEYAVGGKTWGTWWGNFTLLSSTTTALSTVKYYIPYLHTNTNNVVYCIASNSSSDNSTGYFKVTSNDNGTLTGKFNSFSTVFTAGTTNMLTFSGQTVYTGSGSDKIDLSSDTGTSAAYGGTLKFDSTGTSLNCKNLTMGCFQGTTTPKRNLAGFICEDNSTVGAGGLNIVTGF
ncbi:MAG: hypothetical protein H7844_07800 [Nitrospirae bacterium YQR-1]